MFISIDDSTLTSYSSLYLVYHLECFLTGNSDGSRQTYFESGSPSQRGWSFSPSTATQTGGASWYVEQPNGEKCPIKEISTPFSIIFIYFYNKKFR